MPFENALPELCEFGLFHASEGHCGFLQELRILSAADAMTHQREKLLNGGHGRKLTANYPLIENRCDGVTENYRAIQIEKRDRAGPTRGIIDFLGYVFVEIHQFPVIVRLAPGRINSCWPSL
jgi:hypothetical protein